MEVGFERMINPAESGGVDCEVSVLRMRVLRIHRCIHGLIVDNDEATIVRSDQSEPRSRSVNEITPLSRHRPAEGRPRRIPRLMGESDDHEVPSERGSRRSITQQSAPHGHDGSQPIVPHVTLMVKAQVAQLERLALGHPGSRAVPRPLNDERAERSWMRLTHVDYGAEYCIIGDFGVSQ